MEPEKPIKIERVEDIVRAVIATVKLELTRSSRGEHYHFAGTGDLKNWTLDWYPKKRQVRLSTVIGRTDIDLFHVNEFESSATGKWIEFRASNEVESAIRISLRGAVQVRADS